MRSGIELLRWNLRSLIPYGAIVLLLLTAPVIADRLDEQGLPGVGITLGAIVLAAAGSGYAVYTTIPHGRRSREISRLASSLKVPFSRRFAVPDGIKQLPFWQLVPLSNRTVSSGFVDASNGSQIVVFARSYTLDEYEATIWRSCAAAKVPIYAPLARISPHHVGLPPTGMRQLHLESSEFDRRWRVETNDVRFAEALIDQRMMAWLLTLDGLSFEVGGSWVMVDTANEEVSALGQLLDILDALVDHIPRAVTSTYPVPQQEAEPTGP
jgi:hypothetical protein